MAEVERCFVHVDYVSRWDEPPEHKIERDLLAAGIDTREHARTLVLAWSR